MGSIEEFNRLRDHIQICIRLYPTNTTEASIRDSVNRNSKDTDGYLANLTHIVYTLMLNGVSDEEILSLSHEEALTYIYLFI